MHVGGLPDIDAMHPYKWMRTKDEEVSNGFLFLGCSAAYMLVGAQARSAVYAMLPSSFLSLSLEWRFVP